MIDEKLRPTVRRDISLFSVQSWERGYRHYLFTAFDWEYPIFFYYDGFLVNHYHTLKDFTYFKEIITKRLIDDDTLFVRLDNEFRDSIGKLREASKKIDLAALRVLEELIGKIMSFYIFTVSDAFVKARPEAWEARGLSERILYEVDSQVEDFLKITLEENLYDGNLGHYITLREAGLIGMDPGQLDVEEIEKRVGGYIVFEGEIFANISFEEFCRRHHLENSQAPALYEGDIIGQGAFPGLVTGKVVVVRNKKDLSQVGEGDVLVAPMTNVTYMPAFQKAAAVVTDEGGVTCHAAIVAREMKKPCVVGTKTATRMLKNGDLVEVDANKGLIKKIIST